MFVRLCCKGCIFVSEGCCSFHFYVDFCVNIFFVPRGKSSVSSLGCFCCFFFLNFLFCWDVFFILGVHHSRVRGSLMWNLKAFEGQGLRARLCCRKISDSISWLHCFTPL